jgi:hypothetical protein
MPAALIHYFEVTQRRDPGSKLGLDTMLQVHRAILTGR